MALNSNLISALRAQVVVNRGRLRVRKAPVWLFPENVERTYAADLTAIVDKMEEMTNAIFVPHLLRLEDEANASRPSASIRRDALGNTVDDLMGNLRHRINTDIPKGRALAVDIGQKTSDWNDKQWKKTLKTTVGIDIFQSEPWLTSHLEVFTTENVNLITSLKNQPLDQIEELTLRGFQQGVRHETIRKQIEERFDVARSRAKLIARDQVSKLNGQLTELRQTEMGIEEYRWHDSDDSRVRPTHRRHDGEIFRWDKPPADTGHPGQDFQCRCWAEALLDKLIKEELQERVVVPESAVI